MEPSSAPKNAELLLKKFGVHDNLGGQPAPGRSCVGRRCVMVCGFEEIDGRRYYQGWWLQWLAE